MTPIWGNRDEYGMFFMWDESLGFWYSTSGRLVVVVPPTVQRKWWTCVVANRLLEFSGDDAEERAFCVAEGFTRQPSK